MNESLAFKERPSLGHGLFIIYLFIYLFIYLLFETDYKTSLSRVESLSEAIMSKSLVKAV